MALGILTVLCSTPVSASPRKRSKSDQNIDAIGHRQLIKDTRLFSPAKDKETGDKMSAAVEQSVTFLRDPQITAYVERLAQRLAQNSDAPLHITIRILETDRVDAFTLPGGHQYVTRGLLLKLQSEGELAGILAHGIAHTALYSWTRENMRAVLMMGVMSGIPVPSRIHSEYETEEPPSFLKVGWRSDDELDADYFGAQYLYKTGYDPECFVGVIQRLQPVQLSEAFPSLAPLSPRVQALQTEIDTILPKRADAVISSPEFADFQQRLRGLPSLPRVDSGPRPKLARHDTP